MAAEGAQGAARAMNRLSLTARIAEAGALRHTPAGLPALDLRLEHESTVSEGERGRQVNAVVKAVALGAVAERLARQTLGSSWHFEGFLASPRKGGRLVFHIRDFQQDQS